MAANEKYDFLLAGRGYLLARLQGARSWKRSGTPTTAARRLRYEAWSTPPEIDEIDHPETYEDFAGGFGFAYRHPDRPDTIHWSENLDCRFPRQAVHCQQLQVVAGASTNFNVDRLYDVPPPVAAGVTPREGTGAVLAVGRGFIASYSPKDHAAFDRLYEATGGGGAAFQGRPATFGSYTFVGLQSGNFFLRGFDGLAYSQGPIPGQRFAVAAGKLFDQFGDYQLRPLAIGADPTISTGLNWGATLNVGNGQRKVADMTELGGQLFLGLPDGLYAGDASGTISNVLPDVASQRHPDNGRQLAIHENRVVYPCVGGLFDYHPSSYLPETREIGPRGSNRSPVRGHPRAVQNVGPYLLAGYWTGSASYLLAGREDAPGGGFAWHVQQRVPGRVSHLHVDGITSTSGGTQIPQRLWVATDGSLTGTSALYVAPIPRNHGNPLNAEAAFSANYVGSARIDFGRDDWGAPGTPKVYRQLEIVADGLFGSAQWMDAFYSVDGGTRTFLGRATSSPRSVLSFAGLNGNFVTGQDVEISLESFTASVNVTPVLRKVIVRGAIRPAVVDEITAQTRIADGLTDRHGGPMRPGAVMLAELRAAARSGNPQPLIDLSGGVNWVLVRPSVGEQEIYQQGASEPEVAAEVRMTVLDFTTNFARTWDQVDGAFTWSQADAKTWAQLMAGG
jgi:hypothetical protein